MPRLWMLFFVCGIALYGSSDSMAHLGKGNQLLQAERYAEAAVEFQAALKADPALTEARLNLAVCLFEQRQYSQAKDLFAALESGKNARLVSYYLGRIELADGNYDAAIVRFRALEKGPRVNDEQYYLASAYYRKQQFRNALVPLQQWTQINPRDFRAHQLLARTLSHLGRTAEADREFAQTRDLHDYYAQGSIAIGRCRSLLNDGKAEEAWMSCKPMLDTDDADKVAAIGLLFGEAGSKAHALEAWEKGVVLDPESPEVNYNLALAYFDLRDLARARTYAKAALGLWPEFPEANVLYGTILYMLREDAEAKRVLTHALELRPTDTQVRQLLDQLGGQN